MTTEEAKKNLGIISMALLSLEHADLFAIDTAILSLSEYEDLKKEVIELRAYKDKYKWHDLEKDPTDLPLIREFIVGYTEDVIVTDMLHYSVAYYCHSDKKWYSKDTELDMEVVAWKKI